MDLILNIIQNLRSNVTIGRLTKSDRSIIILPTVKMVVFLELLVPTFNTHYFLKECCYVQASLFYARLMFLKNVAHMKHKIHI